jgi:hypothetical protein
MSRQPSSVQRYTYIRGNNNKKKIKEADFPAEAPQSNSHKNEAGNGEHSMHDLSSDSPKEFSLTEISESYDNAKNDGGNQTEKHSGARGIPKIYLSFLVLPYQRQQALCPKREILTDSW